MRKWKALSEEIIYIKYGDKEYALMTNEMFRSHMLGALGKGVELLKLLEGKEMMYNTQLHAVITAMLRAEDAKRETMTVK